MPVTPTTAVRTALAAEMPGQVGTGKRWENAFIDTLTNACLREVAEYCELGYKYQEITALDDTAEYALNDNCIAIYQVEYAVDGSDYDTELTAVTMEDLDSVSRLWRDDSGTWPTRYTVSSTPGVPDLSVIPQIEAFPTITVYPKVSTAGSATIRVRYISTAAAVDQFAVDTVFVPYVRALLAAASGRPEDAAMAPRHYADYISGREELKRTTEKEYAESLGRVR